MEKLSLQEYKILLKYFKNKLKDIYSISYIYQMEYNNNFDPRDDNDVVFDKKAIEDVKQVDRGYNVIWRMFPRPDGTMKRTKLELYTSGGVGCHIRDAETGDYYNKMVGSADEDLFFKVILATGECKSKNGSNTLFYMSPNHYMSHMRQDLSPDTIAKWEEKKSYRMNEIKENTTKHNKMVSVEVH